MKERLEIEENLLGQMYRIAGEKSGGRPLHTHDELELNLVVEGRARYLIDGVKVELDRGALLWLFPSQEHALVTTSPDFAMWVYVFRPELIERACRTEFYAELGAGEREGSVRVRLRPKAFRNLLGLCGETAGHRERDSDLFNAALRYLMLKAWKATVEARSLALESRELHSCVFQAAMVLHQEPETDSLTDLARKVGMSLEHLGRTFKSQMGQTLGEYRTEQRLRKVRELIAEGRLNLLQATLEAGFGSYSQFYRQLRARGGGSPSELRDALRGGSDFVGEEV